MELRHTPRKCKLRLSPPLSVTPEGPASTLVPTLKLKSYTRESGKFENQDTLWPVADRVFQKKAEGTTAKEKQQEKNAKRAERRTAGGVSPLEKKIPLLDGPVIFEVDEADCRGMEQQGSPKTRLIESDYGFRLTGIRKKPMSGASPFSA